jgi:hypothetical protein
MNQPPITYKSNSLSICLKTKNPAALHRSLLIGINEAIQHYVTNPEKSGNGQGLEALLELQKKLLPSEMELEKAYETH